MPKVNDGSRQLDATFSVERTPSGEFAVTVESRSGGKESPGARNVNYERGVEVLLERLQGLNAVLSAAQLVPRTAREGQPKIADLRVANRPFPWILRTEGSPHDLRGRLGAAQAATSRRTGAKGFGNHTKRFRMVCSIQGFDGDGHDLERYLKGEDGLLGESKLPRDEPMSPEMVVAELAGLSAGQGFVSTAKVRKAVEDRAMELAACHFAAAGWTVDSSVAKTCCYDLLCRRGKSEIHVEVKGTMSVGRDVILTRNEVLHAKRQYPNIALAVVTEIKVTASDQPIATGGILRILQPWLPDDAALAPLAYTYLLPPD